MIIRQSTSIDVAIGPFLDSGDSNSQETTLTLTQPDIRLKKNGGAWAQKAAAQTLSHEEAGWYELTLDATDTDTVGQLIVAVHESGALAVWREFQVVEEAVYDALFAASATGLLPANVTQWLGQAAAAVTNNGVPEVDVTHWLGTAAQGASGRPQVDLELWLGSAPNALQSGRVDAYVGAVAAGVIAAASFAANALDAVWSTATRVLTAGTNIVLAKGTGVTGFNDPTVGAIADQVWDEALAGHAGAGSTGEALSDAGGAGTPPTAAAIADAVWDEALAGHAGAGSAGEALEAASSRSAAGAGAITWVVEIDDGADPIEAAHVWVSTDEEGSNIVAGSLLTDSFGLVTFFLDAGTYYVHVRKDGFNPLQAQETEVA